MLVRSILVGFGVLLVALPLQARPAKPAQHGKAAATDTGGGLQIMPWVSFDDEAARSAKSLVGRSSTIATAEDLKNRITVYDKHRDMRNDIWRHELEARQPSYQASNSDAASSPYTSYPQWDSPQEERLMSTVKDSLGICGWPLSCPNPAP